MLLRPGNVSRMMTANLAALVGENDSYVQLSCDLQILRADFGWPGLTWGGPALDDAAILGRQLVRGLTDVLVQGGLDQGEDR